MACNGPRLPVELLHQICSHFCIHCQEYDCLPSHSGDDIVGYYSKRKIAINRARSTLAALCRTSRLLRQVAEPYLYHSILINEGNLRYHWKPSKHLLILRNLIARPELAQSAELVVIEDTYAHRSFSPTIADQLVAARRRVNLPTDNLPRSHQAFHIIETLLAYTTNVKFLHINLQQQALAPFSSNFSLQVLPSLEVLSLTNAVVNPMPQLRGFDHKAPRLRSLCLWPMPPHSLESPLDLLSSVVNLCLVQEPGPCLLSAASLIRSCGRLESFTMVQDVYGWQRGKPLLEAMIANVMGALRNHKHSLRELTLSLGDGWDDGRCSASMGWNGTGLISSLLEFEKLEYLCVPLGAFQRLELDDGSGNVSTPVLWPNMLPQSLKHFRADNILDGVFSDLNELAAAIRDGNFPSLSKISMLDRDIHDVEYSDESESPTVPERYYGLRDAEPTTDLSVRRRSYKQAPGEQQEELHDASGGSTKFEFANAQLVPRRYSQWRMWTKAPEYQYSGRPTQT